VILDVGMIFRHNIKGMIHERKTSRLDSIRTKNFCSTHDKVKTMRPAKGREETFAKTHI
jgi:hypothetical protein